MSLGSYRAPQFEPARTPSPSGPAGRPPPRPAARPTPPRYSPQPQRAQNPKYYRHYVAEVNAPKSGLYGKTALKALMRGNLVTGAISLGLSPTPVGIADYTPTAEDLAYAEAMDSDNQPGQIMTSPPPQMVYIKPNGQSAILLPSSTPDPFVPHPGPYEPWFEPMEDIEYIMPDQLPYRQPARIDNPDLQTAGQPQRGPDTRVNPYPGVLPQAYPGAKTLDKPGQNIELKVEFAPNGQMRIRTRVQTKRRWNRKKKDKKLNKWYLQALRVISNTWGVVDEVIQFGEAVTWNAFNAKGQYAMHLENGNQLAVFQGLAEGTYTLDLVGAVTDYAFGQTMDAAIGISSRAINKSLADTGMWNQNRGFSAGLAF